MKAIITSLLCLLPFLANGAGITNGQYEITFRISDMGFQQEVTITNCWWTDNLTTMYCDVVIEKNGSLKRFDGDRQTVRGILYIGKFKFIILFANVVNVDAFVFEGSDEDRDGILEGTGDVPFQGPNGGNNKFEFSMRRKPRTKRCRLSALARLSLNADVSKKKNESTTIQISPRSNRHGCHKGK